MAFFTYILIILASVGMLYFFAKQVVSLVKDLKVYIQKKKGTYVDESDESEEDEETEIDG